MLFKKNKFKELLLKIVTRNILYHQYFMKYIQFFLRPIVGSIFSPEIPVERNFKKREKIFRQRKICDHQWRVPFVIATPVSIDFRIYANILIEAYEKLVSVIIDRVLPSRNFRDRGACRCPAQFVPTIISFLSAGK